VGLFQCEKFAWKKSVVGRSKCELVGLVGGPLCSQRSRPLAEMHEINLQRAWERHVSPDQCIAWVRWFQKPSNIGSGEQVFLVADPCRLRTMWLNCDSLVGLEYKEGNVCISERLCQRNSLIFCQSDRPECNTNEWFTEITSGRLASDRVVLPIEFGKVGLKIG
jgi:hypothetical protein